MGPAEEGVYDSEGEKYADTPVRVDGGPPCYPNHHQTLTSTQGVQVHVSRARFRKVIHIFFQCNEPADCLVGKSIKELLTCLFNFYIDPVLVFVFYKLLGKSPFLISHIFTGLCDTNVVNSKCTTLSSSIWQSVH